VAKRLILSLVVLAVWSAGAGQETFTGVITDDMCARADHASMRMGPTDAECTVQCVMVHGASYVLFDGKQVFMLTDQEKPEKFAGKEVTITGTLDPKNRTKTILVESISAAR
jgi:hypothetical protein